MDSSNEKLDQINKVNDEERRDFIVLAASGTAAVGAACSLWPLVDSLNPASDVLALASVECDLSNIKPGESMIVKWRGKPVFVKHRTPEEIVEARNTELKVLVDPELDEKRVKPDHDKWLIVVGICTHLGCVPVSNKGEYGGWFCPCHGSHYDVSGRIRKGPAPKNLEIPPYEFLSDTKVRIG